MNYIELHMKINKQIIGIVIHALVFLLFDYVVHIIQSEVEQCDASVCVEYLFDFYY